MKPCQFHANNPNCWFVTEGKALKLILCRHLEGTSTTWSLHCLGTSVTENARVSSVPQGQNWIPAQPCPAASQALRQSPKPEAKPGQDSSAPSPPHQGIPEWGTPHRPHRADPQAGIPSPAPGKLWAAVRGDEVSSHGRTLGRNHCAGPVGKWRRPSHLRFAATHTPPSESFRLRK